MTTVLAIGNHAQRLICLLDYYLRHLLTTFPIACLRIAGVMAVNRINDFSCWADSEEEVTRVAWAEDMARIYLRKDAGATAQPDHANQALSSDQAQIDVHHHADQQRSAAAGLRRFHAERRTHISAE